VDAYAFADTNIGNRDQMRKRIIAYPIAGSFCRYRINDGLGGNVMKFMEIFHAGDFQAATGKSRDALIADRRKKVLAA